MPVPFGSTTHPSSRRRFATLCAEIERTKRQLRRAKAAVARSEITLGRMQTARRQLPLQLAEVAIAAERRPSLWPKGFRRELDAAIVGQVREALLAPTFAAVLDGVADALGCDRLAVLLTETGRAVRRGAKSRILRLRYQFDPAMNEVVRAAGQAFFDGHRTRAWDVVLDAGTIVALETAIPDHFAAVIDLDAMAVLVNPSEPTKGQRTAAAFGLLPFHLAVEPGAVLAALRAARKADPVAAGTLYIHSGTAAGFMPFADDHRCFTRMPFLLLRYAVPGGRPRYAALSTLALQVEEVSFGNAAGGTQRAIARYADTCRVHRVPAVTRDGDPALLAEQPGQRAAAQGGFERFAPVLEAYERLFPDLPIAPLASDLITLTGTGHGFDCAASGTIAYVRLDGGAADYLRAIAAFFGERGCPVVFARDYLDRWAAGADGGLVGFEDTLTHEAAHWLWWLDPGRTGTDPHDRRWALYADLLTELLDDTPPLLCRRPHPDHGFANAGVAEVAAALRRDAGCCGPFSIEALHGAVEQCLALGNLLDR